MTTTTTTKTTYVSAIDFVLDTYKDALPQDVAEKLTALRDQTAKRNGASAGKPTKTQEANIALKAVIVDAVRAYGKGGTITEIQTATPALADLSNQKLSALFKQLTDAGVLTKTTEKRKSYFTVANAEA